MKNRTIQNAEAIAELGMLTSANLKLQHMEIAPEDPLAAYQERMDYWNGRFSACLDIAADEVVDMVSRGRKINKVIFAGYEAIFMDKVVTRIDKKKKVIAVPNNPFVNQGRMAMNHGEHQNFSVQDIYRVWEAIGNEAIVFIPYFELADGSCWVYRYCAPLVNEELLSKARVVVGINLLSGLDIEAGYDTVGALSLLTEVNASVFDQIISIEPQTATTHELDYIASAC
jgi:hypothetical protein